MIDIESVGQEFALSYNETEGDYFLAFHFKDIPGTVRKANISVFALRELVRAVDECQAGMLQHFAPPGQTSTMKLTLGYTIGESYASEVSHG